ncbi:MAG TPA: HDIG domain-containing protein [Gemmatimonadaceae bacterium]|nr:HDIG domain-containing protein [Gemmatimonadaceae bacterium]
MDARIPQSGAVTVAPDTGHEKFALHAPRIALLLAIALVTYLLFPTSAAVDSPIFEIGSVATQNVIAPFGFTVRKSETDLREEREQLARSAKPIFVYSPAALDSSQQQLSTLMRSVATAVDSAGKRNDAAAATRVAMDRGLALTPAEGAYLARADRRRALQEAVRRAYARWLPEGLAAAGALDEVQGELLVRRGTEERNVLADSVLTLGTLLRRARPLQPDPNSSVADGLYLKLLAGLLHPTIIPDPAATEKRRADLRASVDVNRYIVRAGEKIVGEHEVVGRAEFDKMHAMHDAIQSTVGGDRAFRRVLGGIAYNALVLAIFGIAILVFRPGLYRSMRALALFAAVFTLVLVVAAITAQWQPVRPELVPVAIAAIIISMLFDARISMIAAMILAVLAGGQSVYRGTNALFLNLIGGAAAALSMRTMLRRDDGYRYVLTIGVAYLFAAVTLGLTLGWTTRQIGVSAGFGVLNAFVSVVLAMFLMPLAERLTGVTTSLTLVEWSDLNRPLLRRLSLEAPGTYAHTIAMANLVEAACNAIGANGLLGRVGTYYHDIGKLAKPQYFVENQAGGRNPHDMLKPGTSATIIRNHIQEGLDLAAEYHLPAAISAFIPEHHGTGHITYFEEKARGGDGAPVPNVADYIYPGPVPQSAETAICMLADGVEASVRVLQEPTQARIREVIDHIVKQRVDQGQLHQAPLTLKDLDVIKDEFARVYASMNHARIDYPTASGGVTSEFATV